MIGLPGLFRAKGTGGKDAAAAGAERRIDVRHPLPSTRIDLRAGGMVFALRLKDLSSSGFCGLTDAPLAPGQIVYLLAEQAEPLPARVRWIRRALIGAEFAEPLRGPTLARLKPRRSSRGGGAAR